MGVGFVSDGDANLALWASVLMRGAAALSGVDETGAFQDLTSLLGTPFKVEVVSDVSAVPEPAASALLLSVLAMLGCARLRRRL